MDLTKSSVSYNQINYKNILIQRRKHNCFKYNKNVKYDVIKDIQKTPIRTYKTNKLLKNRDIINDYSFIGNNNDSNININYLNMDTFKNNINQDELTNYRKSSKTNLNSNRKGKISRAKCNRKII